MVSDIPAGDRKISNLFYSASTSTIAYFLKFLSSVLPSFLFIIFRTVNVIYECPAFPEVNICSIINEDFKVQLNNFEIYFL